MVPVIVIEDQEDAFQTIASYVQDYRASRRLTSDAILLERARTYEEWGELLERYRPHQVLLIIDIRLPPKNANEIIQVLKQRNNSIPLDWPVIIYSVVFDNSLRKIPRRFYTFIHKLEDPHDAPSARIKLRNTMYDYLDLLFSSSNTANAS